MRKGIVLAGGQGTRLHPITRGISKQMLPVYDKPMIYYPISVLMLAGIREILVISTPHDLPRFEELLGDGSEIGVSFSYAVQEDPRGLPDAFIVGAEFVGRDNVTLILGDNIFFGTNFSAFLQRASAKESGATLFTYDVLDPRPFGVVEFDENRQVVSLEEKPEKPRSKHVATGLYFYDNDIVEIARNLEPSARGELEITDANQEYLKRGALAVEPLGRGYAWFDTGNFDALLDAGNFVATVERRQGMKIACLEEIAWRQGWIPAEQLLDLAARYRGAYADYLRDLVAGTP